MTTIEIPQRLATRPVFHGMIVPYGVLVLPDGRPDFKIPDLQRWFECAEKKLCAVCGDALDYWVWYLGGKVCVENEIYYDLAMHEECARYSAYACPYVAGRKGYAQHLPTLEGLDLNEEFAAPPADKRIDMYLAKGHRGKMKFDFKAHRVHTGTLIYTEKVERSNGTE
jgi:hypothetical protein